MQKPPNLIAAMNLTKAFVRKHQPSKLGNIERGTWANQRNIVAAPHGLYQNPLLHKVEIHFQHLV